MEVIMTLIRRSENLPMWTNLFNDFFNQDWNDWSLRNFSLTNTTLPSVNIKETGDNFEVEMAAPGMDKSDFKIEVNQGILTISSEKMPKSLKASIWEKLSYILRKRITEI